MSQISKQFFQCMFCGHQCMTENLKYMMGEEVTELYDLTCGTQNQLLCRSFGNTFKSAPATLSLCSCLEDRESSRLQSFLGKRKFA